MVVIYYLAVRAYVLGIYAFAIVNKKAARWISGRKNWRTTLKDIPFSAKRVWIHCASLGEFEQALPLIKKLEQSRSQVVVSFFSPSGYDVIQRKKTVEHIVYLPSDSPSHAREFITLLRPDFAVFVKYEFWYFYLKELKNRSIPQFFISSVFRENQLFFKSYGWWFRRMLHYSNHIFCQHLESVEILNKYGIKHASHSGDTRFDRVMALSEKVQENTILKRFSEGRFVVIAGSSWEKEEELVANYVNRHLEAYVVITPHDVSSAHIEGVIKKLKVPYVLYSKINEFLPASTRVIIIDSVGFLAQAYFYADVALVGGGFKNALHNILEPATFAIPVIYGNNCAKFPEGAQLAQAGGGFIISSGSEFETIVNRFHQDNTFLADAAKKARLFVEDRAGATEKIYDYFREKGLVED